MASPAAPPGALDERAEALLRAAGQRVTKPRVAVLASVLAADGDHLSAEEILSQVAARSDGAHRATVYRTLDGLADAGVLLHVHLDRGLTAYHLVDPHAGSAADHDHEHPAHLHAQCVSCGRVVDLPSDVLGDTADRVRRASGFALDASHVALSGRCADCAAQP
ncbi:MAG TPA: Fur family transcriptional regulator [Mycobacteriales bacterium]|jgi:Fur family ferric uptake transcriptional regulator|nr:Fur family transcriptional regulator [Mycobacteriales bacterium]